MAGLVASLAPGLSHASVAPHIGSPVPVTAPISLDAGVPSPVLHLSAPGELARAGSLARLPVPLALDVPSMPDAPVVTEQASTPELEAAAVYRLGLFKMSQGDFAGAQKLFEQVRSTYPDTAAGKAAAQRLVQLAPTPMPGGVSAGSTPAPSGPVAGAADDPTNSGRAEFVVSQTLVGGLMGALLPFAASTSYVDPKAPVLTGMMGLGVGLGGSLLMSSIDQISSAEALSWWGTQTLLTVNTYSWYHALGGSDNGNSFQRVVLGGLALGTVGGYFVSHYLPFSEGQVATVLGAATWAPVLSIMATAALNPDLLSDDALFYMVPLSADIAALAVGKAVLDLNLPISRSRMRLINLGGIVGALMGGGFFILSESHEGQVFAGMALAGGLVGLGSGVYFTRSWDKTYHPELFASNSSALFAVENGKLKFGNFIPSVGFEQVQEQVGEQKVARLKPTLNITFASGTF